MIYHEKSFDSFNWYIMIYQFDLSWLLTMINHDKSWPYDVSFIRNIYIKVLLIYHDKSYWYLKLISRDISCWYIKMNLHEISLWEVKLRYQFNFSTRLLIKSQIFWFIMISQRLWLIMRIQLIFMSWEAQQIKFKRECS